jgi:hypothetical protein
MAAATETRRFLATIYKIWMLRYVDVPQDVGRALAKAYAGRTGQVRVETKEKYIPVLAIVNGRSTRTTLVPAGGGRYRLPFNATLRKAARANVGEVTGVELRVDLGSRELPVPPELQAAFKTHPVQRKVFDKIGPGTRRQFILFLNRAKSPEVRRKAIARLMDILLERALLAHSRPKRTK